MMAISVALVDGSPGVVAIALQPAPIAAAISAPPLVLIAVVIG
jgi:hypothetical protein